MAALSVAALPPRDLDAYWHVLIGRQIIADHTVEGVGAAWPATPTPGWRTSQWLSEVLMALLVDTLGWTGLLILQLSLASALLLCLTATLLPRRPQLIAIPVLAIVIIGVVPAVQDRPQSISYLALALLAAACAGLIRDGRPPRRLLVAAGCLVWAQFHGLWIVAPAAFSVIAIGTALGGPATAYDRPATAYDRQATDRSEVRDALLTAVAAMAGVVNPHGFGSFLLPARLKAATPFIAEWRPAAFDDLPTILWAILLLAILAAWLHSPVPVPRVELAWVLAWWVFGVLAYRNIAPSLLLLAPTAITALSRTWGSAAWARTTPSSPLQTRALRAGLALVLAGGALGVGGIAARTDPLAQAPARHLAQRLAQSPTPVRVFNAYNTGGALAAFGGGKVRLAVDGRADLWGAPYITKIIDAQRLGRGWRATFESFHPDAVVLSESAPLAVLLVHDGTWRIDARDGDYVLLLPVSPEAAAWPDSQPRRGPQARPDPRTEPAPQARPG